MIYFTILMISKQAVRTKTINTHVAFFDSVIECLDTVVEKFNFSETKQ